MIGILVHGDNHFVVAGVCPDRAAALHLVRQWTVIQVGPRPETAGWEIVNQAFREDLEWAVVVAGGSAHSQAVVVLLAEMEARGIVIQRY